jgi:D-tyrosyl-tRNA(Tyr) deacylase
VKVVVQRAAQASVSVDGQPVGVIGRGALVFVGVAPGDDEATADYLADKILNLRIFDDDQGRMNLSLLDVQGEALVVSQFTLLADCRRGRRPSFVGAAEPAAAERLYERLAERLAASVVTAKGRFGAHMAVSLVNDGPATFLLEKTPGEPCIASN